MSDDNVQEEKVELKEIKEEVEQKESTDQDLQDDKTAEKIDDEEKISVKEEVDYKSKVFYLAAEMENQKKRFEREKANLVKFGNERVLTGMLDVLDNLERTVDSIKESDDDKIKNIVTGISMVKDQFSSVLKNNGLEKVECLGKIFDPNFHEAMSQQALEGKKDQEIINVFQDGYVLNGRLLRAAKVIIAKN